MAPFLAACGKHLAAAFRLHANAETVRFSPAALARLICALWQSNSPLILTKIVPKRSRVALLNRRAIAGFGANKPNRVGSCSGIF
jgi:hypothetical protein